MRRPSQALYAGTGCYYFHAFRPETGTVARIIVFIAITALYLSVALNLASSGFTFLAYSMPLRLTAASCSCYTVRFEIFTAGMVTTSRTTGGWGRKHRLTPDRRDTLSPGPAFRLYREHPWQIKR